MRQSYAHVNDEDLLLYAGGELEEAPERVEVHLAGCELCRSRMEKLQNGLSEFSEVYRQHLSKGAPATEARAALKARMELDTRHAAKRSTFGWGAAAAAGLLLAIWLWPAHLPRSAVALDQRERPDLVLTPGATIPVTQSEICAGGEPAAPVVPVSLQQMVFERYGVTRPRDQYEVDYLITPELGGATDIRNLWPEPYHGAVWNAHVKDQLEDRLHSMVCRGEVDLATAQRDIATDWIAAYRKYFHADAPVSTGSSMTFPESKVSLPLT
jgi:hypothetical protein